MADSCFWFCIPTFTDHFLTYHYTHNLTHIFGNHHLFTHIFVHYHLSNTSLSTIISHTSCQPPISHTFSHTSLSTIFHTTIPHTHLLSTIFAASSLTNIFVHYHLSNTSFVHHHLSHMAGLALGNIQLRFTDAALGDVFILLTYSRDCLHFPWQVEAHLRCVAHLLQSLKAQSVTRKMALQCD